MSPTSPTEQALKTIMATLYADAFVIMDEKEVAEALKKDISESGRPPSDEEIASLILGDWSLGQIPPDIIRRYANLYALFQREATQGASPPQGEAIILASATG